ncbi:MAG: hypothetical protein ABIN91_11655 [Mucilaginibacter sp.]|uniref:hypothetical protein n=1 Tax=Mucilaginibacter sp. TaxID=1882438 RepID=UPI003264860A
MRISSLFSIVGFILLIAGTFSPLLSFVVRMNVYSLNKPYGIAMLAIAVVGLLCALLQQRGLTRVMAILSLVLVVALYGAAVTKVSTAFSFIPLKGLSSGLSHLIKFKWGWYVLFVGGVISVAASIANRPPRITNPAEVAPV